LKAREPRSIEEIVKMGHVKKYVFRPSGRVRWIVVGRHRDYIVFTSVPYCSCDDFFFRVIHGSKHNCYHIEAVKLAIQTGSYETIEEGDEWYDKLMAEWTDFTKQ
jgi:predicted nucleic acid-binding Zn finger protein